MDNIFNDFPILSDVLGISEEDAICDCRTHYNNFELKTRGSKKTRKIDSPCPHLKLAQRALLDRIISQVEPHETAMAFVRNKSIAMNARRHQGASHLFKTDICSFFSSIKAAEVSAVLEKRFLHLSRDVIEEIVALVTLDSRLPQGAPTSPHIANLALYEFDERCHWFSDRLGAVYTRYADDISISSADAEVLHNIEFVVREGIRTLGMEVREAKTRHYGPNQRKTVTGLDIGTARLRPPRAFRKKATALVRMAVKYPEKMAPYRSRITGHLAFWYDVDPADRELAELLVGLGLNEWARRVSSAADLAQSSHPSKSVSFSKSALGDDIPF